MKSKFLLFITGLAVIIITSCNKTASDLALYVPKDATVVFTVDLKTISDKINASGIGVDSLVNLFSNDDKSAKTNWNDIKNSGVDLNKSVYFFSRKNNSIQNGSTENSAFIAELKDAGKLELFLKKQKPGNTASSANGYKYFSLGNNSIAGWTDKILIVSTAEQNGNNAAALAQQQLQTLFAQKENESIASVKEFKNALSKTGDIHFYTNASNTLSNAPVPGSSKINELLKDSYTEGVVSFEKGKMSGTSETHYNSTLSNIIDKYPSKEIDEAMIKKYPGTLSGFMIVSFNPKVLVDILNYLGFDVIANGFTQNLGFTTSDIVNAFSGDIAAMFSPSESSPSNASFLLNMKIGDKAAFDKMMTGLLNKQLLTKNGDTYQLGLAGGHGFVIETDNTNVYISSSDELIKAYKTSANNSALPADADKEIKGKSMAIYVDINNLLSKKSMKDSANTMQPHNNYYTDAVQQEAKATFKNFVATTDVNNNDVFKSEFELNFVNQGENSLTAFTKFAAIAHEAEKNRKATLNYPPSSNPDGNNNSEEKDSGTNK